MAWRSRSRVLTVSGSSRWTGDSAPAAVVLMRGSKKSGNGVGRGGVPGALVEPFDVFAQQACGEFAVTGLDGIKDSVVLGAQGCQDRRPVLHRVHGSLDVAHDRAAEGLHDGGHDFV